MNKQNNLRRAMDKTLPGLEQDVWFEQRVMNRIHEQPRCRTVSKRAVALLLAAGLLLLSATAVAAVLLSGREVVDEYAVPMAIGNDTKVFTQGSYTHEELAELIRTLNENSISLDEESTIMQAFRSGHGYWEEDVIEAVCTEAFGSRMYAWSVEEKYWYDTLLVKIGAKERSWYALPDETDMTVPEARAHAAKLINAEYSLTLPSASNEDWLICEYFYAADDIHPAMWYFDFVNRKDSTMEYGVHFDREGMVIRMEDVGAIYAAWEQSITGQEAFNEDPVREAEYRRRQDAYQKYQQTYGENWFFWPLEAQQEALGGHHHIPEGNEMPRDKAIEYALNAICQQYGEDVLNQLGNYQVGAICKRYQESEGLCVSWCIYVTSDPVYVSDGFRVEFDDPSGVQKTDGIMVMPANAGNG